MHRFDQGRPEWNLVGGGGGGGGGLKKFSPPGGGGGGGGGGSGIQKFAPLTGKQDVSVFVSENKTSQKFSKH